SDTALKKFADCKPAGASCVVWSGPASSNNTDAFASSDNRAASTAPAEPAPTTITSYATEENVTPRGSIRSQRDRGRGVRRSELSVGVDHVAVAQGSRAAPRSGVDVALVLSRDPRRLRRRPDDAGGAPGGRDRCARPLASD